MPQKKGAEGGSQKGGAAGGGLVCAANTFCVKSSEGVGNVWASSVYTSDWPRHSRSGAQCGTERARGRMKRARERQGGRRSS